MALGSKRSGFRSALVALVATTVFTAATPGEAPVADAAERGDLATVRALLREGADASAAQPDGTTALHWAAINNGVEIAEVLLYAGATVRATTRLGGYTALHLAARSGNAEVTSVLMEGGADANLYTATGVTALHFAAEANSAETIRALVAHGADVNAEDRFSNRTPLIFAAVRNSVEAIDALLDAGADVSRATAVKDYEEIARLQTEERQARERVRAAAKKPEEGDDESGSGRVGSQRRTPATPARTVGQGEPDEKPDGEKNDEEKPEEPPVKALSSLQQIGKQGGFSALHYAAREGHLGAARHLIDAGADVDQLSGGDQSSPILVATINGNYDLARLLLESGADPNLVSDDGAGPLFATLNIEWSLRTWYPQPSAFRQQETPYLEYMALLLEAGADPNQRTETHIWYAAYNAGRMGVDFTGATPFWRAAYAADVKAMRLLVEHGADPDIWTIKLPSRRRFFPGNPPSTTAPESDDEDPSGLEPIPLGGPAVHPFHAAAGVGFGTSRVAQQHRSVPNGLLPAMKYFVEELGVDPNLRDKDGFSAMHHIASRGDNETLRYLVSRGGDVTLVARSGQTIADMANSPEQRAQPHPATVALLEKLGSKNNHNCRSCGGE